MNTGSRDEPRISDHGARHGSERQIGDYKGAGAGRGGNIRESIWSISSGWQSMYFAFFSLQLVLGLSVVLWYHVFEHVEDSVVETLIGAIRDSASVSVWSAGTSYTLAEGARFLMILASNLEQWINRKWEERDARNRAAGLEEGEQKGRAIGVEEGEKKGRVAERAEWEDRFAELRAWNDRRMAAESRGEFFDEPMPGSDNGSVHAKDD